VNVTSQVQAPVGGPGSSAPAQWTTLGWWLGPDEAVSTDQSQWRQALLDISGPLYAVLKDGRLAFASGGEVHIASGIDACKSQGALPVIGYVPAVALSQLGDAGFCADHGIRYAYMTGAMANGIASVEVVNAAANAGVLGSYGAAGQSIELIESAIDRLLEPNELIHSTNICHPGICFNLIHSPNEPQHEAAVVELYLKRGVRRVEASAYLRLTEPVVRYRVSGIYRAEDGRVVAPNQIIAKASRIEVATRWFSPPPQKMLDALLQRGQITADEAELARHIPMAQDLTAEADSGGHTDNRPALTLIPTLVALRDRMQAEHGYDVPLRIGAAGGVATPASAAAALAMGASYIVTGSVNQACIESGSSDDVRQMLAEAQQADVVMAPAADMFEMGVKLQVLKRGTMFAIRANKLYELYRSYPCLEQIPDDQRKFLEQKIFRAPLDEIWDQTQQFFAERDPIQLEKAASDPRHRMALVFRWYLGMSSTWANHGHQDRKIDYQVWCGPAMGAFNEWTRGSYLEQARERRVADVAANILYGAAVLKRVDALAAQGVHLPAEVTRVTPQPSAKLERFFR